MIYLKMMIELSDDFLEADRIIEEYTDARLIGEKLELVGKLWPEIKILDGWEHDDSEMLTDYQVLIATIMNKKWG